MRTVNRRSLALPAKSGGDRSRFDFIDLAKAVGILMIMVGHSPGLPALAHRLIFSFHVPLFYVVSGFLIGHRKLALDFGSYGYRIFRRLFLPYCLFFMLAYCYWLATRSIGPRAIKFADVAWYEPLRGFADGLGDDLFICPPLWFFPSLMVTSLAFHAMRRRVSAANAGAACLLAGLANAATARFIPWRLPWGLDTLGVALSCYAAGHCLRQWMERSGSGLEVPWRGLLALVFIVFWVDGALANRAIDINERYFDGRPLLVIPTALCGSASLLLLGTLIPRMRLSRWLSRHTLVIFPLHPIVFNIISGIRELVFKMPPASLHNPWLPLIYTGGSLLAIAPVLWTIDVFKSGQWSWPQRGSIA